MEQKSIEIVKENVLHEFLKFTGNANKLTPEETMYFISLAQTFNLNPLKREIHISVYGEGQFRQLSIVTGYEVYIKRAERTGKLDGWDVVTNGHGDDLTATITIHRKDRSRPFSHTVHYSEYVQKKKDGTVNKFWKEKPITMLKKVAISQGFRLCFCDELDGMPYTSDEMPIEEKEINSVSINQSTITQPKPELTKIEIDSGQKFLDTLKKSLLEATEEMDEKRIIEKSLPKWVELFDQKKISDEIYRNGNDRIAAALKYIESHKKPESVAENS